MSSLSGSLTRVLQIGGVQAAAVIDIGTGMVLGAGGAGLGGLADAAPSLAEEARLAIRAGGPDHLGGELEEIALATASRVTLTRVLEYGRGEGLLLFVDIDLAQTNAALAGWELYRLWPDLLSR